MTPLERRKPQLIKFIQYMFTNRTAQWNDFVKMEFFSDGKYNSYIMTLYTCQYDSIRGILKELMLECGWYDMFDEPQEIVLHASNTQTATKYKIYTMKEEVEEFCSSYFMPYISFVYPSLHSPDGRVSWTHEQNASYAIAKYVRIFTIDDIIHDLNNE